MPPSSVDGVSCVVPAGVPHRVRMIQSGVEIFTRTITLAPGAWDTVEVIHHSSGCDASNRH
jgi:hypothetical protein